MLLFITALTLGFLGSFHCVGMCGPIALALPLNRTTWWSAVGGTLAYNGGRILTYALLGTLFGLAGKTFVIAGYQRWLTIAIGLILLAIVLLPARLAAKSGPSQMIYGFIAKRKSAIGQLFTRSNPWALALIGLLNGLLPCGFVYLGIAGSISSGSAFNGALFMAAFGAGTLPAMLVLSLAGNSLPVTARNTIRKAAPYFIALMALLFILRGMNLGIPYLSPHLTTVTDTRHNCCHK